MKAFLVTWRSEGGFTLRTPWWTLCEPKVYRGALRADDEQDARRQIADAHDDARASKVDVLSVCEYPKSWSPFRKKGERWSPFNTYRESWMVWPALGEAATS